MEEANDNLSMATVFNNLKDKKKKQNKKTNADEESEKVAVDSATAPNNGGSGSSSDANPRICLFDLSADNFFRDMDTIARLCGEEERNAAVEQSEIKRMSSSVTFLRYMDVKN